MVSDAQHDVMQLMLSTPVPTARARPMWVDDSAHWTEIGEVQSHYVPMADRPRRSPWIPVLLALFAAFGTTAASAATVLTVLLVAFVL